MNIYGVIMAGGGGTRFWPLSRQNKPKQLLNLSGQDVLINETVKRINKIVDFDKIYIVTNEKQDKPLKEVILKRCMEENILLEPAARNTAACIGYAAFTILKRCGDGIMCVFPSDHYIRDEERFTQVMNTAVEMADTYNKLVTIGITPTFPSTGYGYIRYDMDTFEKYNSKAFDVVEFVEKPGLERAKEYIKADYLWNSGIFVWKVSTILDNFKRYIPKVYNKLEEISKFLGTEAEHRVLSRVYPTIPGISIDYGIMERSDDVLVVPGDFGWNDVGSWDTLGAIYPTDKNGNIIKANHINIDTSNTIIYGNDRLIATIGLDDMIVVDTDDALLVCPKNRAQDVKHIVEELKRTGKEEYL